MIIFFHIMFLPWGYIFFLDNLKQKETELRKLMECLHLHNPCVLRGVHRPDSETPPRVSTQLYRFWKVRIENLLETADLVEISHQVTTDFSCNIRSLLLQEISEIGDSAIGKAACSRVEHKLDSSSSPSTSTDPAAVADWRVSRLN